jgi:hypothetical protein
MESTQLWFAYTVYPTTKIFIHENATRLKEEGKKMRAKASSNHFMWVAIICIRVFYIILCYVHKYHGVSLNSLVYWYHRKYDIQLCACHFYILYYNKKRPVLSISIIVTRH